MALYIGLSIFYILVMLLEWMIGKRLNSKLSIIILLLPLFILAGFRATTVGNDTLNYYTTFLSVSQENLFSSTVSRLEIGYIFLMRIIGNLGLSYLGFQIITTAFIFLSIGRFIYKYSLNPALSVFVFVTSRMFFGTMNISRQYIAIAILLYSIDFLKKREFTKFFIIVFLASLFHSSALVFLILYPIALVKLNKKRIILFIGVGTILSIIFDNVIQLVINLTNKYQGYLDSQYFNFEGNTAIYFQLAIYFIFFIVGSYTGYWKSDYNNIKEINSNTINKRIRKSNNKGVTITNEMIWYVAALLTFIIGIVGLNSTIMDRIAMYFSVFYLAYIPSLITKIRSKHIRVIIINGIILGLFLSFCIVMIYRPNWNTVFPYVWYQD
ncbi:EpsG family protein [Bacillus salacetis]|uniref:EpsG family protein n=1 Tax=Bacillus salacetis TaxID=2315464 RepID=A0A3A1R1X2_9BACI|nr:EpsG family protein [Bacillus salacetis]RIW36054.1 EpsG family protein [Bacillus salacetis]